MTELHRAGSRPTARDGGDPRLVLASRGDALTPYLFAALERRYPVIGRIDAELTRAQRYRVAATTFRPSRSRWAERFYKSAYGTDLRSRNAARALHGLDEPDAVFQIHALFDLAHEPTVLYVDCTHRQSARHWPAWNPLRGRALRDWYDRETRSYHAARHIFSFSTTTAASLVDDYGVPASRVTITGAGANLDELPGPRPTGADRVRTAPTILFIGNDFVRKGGMVLLEAFERVRSVLPDARLQLVGTDPGIAPRPGVEVLGRIRDRSRIEGLYRDADVFTMPSFFDPFPLVLLEAMAFGLPVVATAQEGVPEMIDDRRTGLLVEPGRADALADALLTAILDEDASARLGAAARDEIASRFTWDDVVARMAPGLDGLVARATR